MPWWGCGQCKESNEDNIVCLDYNHMSLTEVPTEIFTFERTLEDLYLESNRITDLPRQLFHCHGLKTLNISDNEITNIPPAISALVNLQWLDLSKNSVTTLPDTIRNCTNLTYLNVSLNPIEKLCDPLTSVLSLHELHLNDIYLEFLPANFGRLTNLRILELRENNLITLPKSMARLVNLTRLDIGQNEFTELPEVVCNLLNLHELWIDSNRIRRLPSNVGQLRKLIHFDASNNCLQTLPRHIGYWTKVVEFCVTNNDIHEVPSTVGNMKNLKGLKLDENRIQILPDSIGKLNNLEELMLAHNDIVMLPETIGLLRKLQVLSVDKNLLSNLPIEIGSCISLRILSLRSNRLKYIPAELGHLSNLRVLNLINNQLQELPVSLLKLTKLAALWLSDNQSQPLIPLQQDFNHETSHMYLTCFMLPQYNTDNAQENNNQNLNDNTGLTLPSGRRHICFAPDAGLFDEPQRLSRAPTPYPKDLRALARHVRLMQRGLHLVPSAQQTCQDKLDETETNQMQGPSDVIEIKEAKVTYKNDQNLQQSSQAPVQQPVEPIYVSKTANNDTKIREAKFVRTYSVSDSIPNQQTYKNESQSTTNSDICDNQVPSTQIPPPPPAPVSAPPPQQQNLPQQPPPYYIAAAQSLHAEYFNNLSKQRPTLAHGNADNMNMHNVNVPSRNNHIDIDNLSLKSLEIQNQRLREKPPTFIQDKPIVGQHIIAPTPQRLHPLINDNEIVKPPSIQLLSGTDQQGHVAHSPTSQDMDMSVYSDWNSFNNETLTNNRQTKWLFGKHKNASVMQIRLRKTNNDFGFRITDQFNNGIFVSEVIYNGSAQGLLKPGDKILDVDNIDFTKINFEYANEVLRNSGPIINLMISRT